MAYSGLTKSRSNKSGRKSPAAKQSEARKKRAKSLYTKATKSSNPRRKKPKNTTPNRTRSSGLPMKPLKLNPRTPIQLPETTETRKGMTLKQLMRSTPRLFVNNAKDVVIVSAKKAKTRSGMPAFVAETMTQDLYRPDRYPRKRTVHVIGLDKFKSGDPNVEKPISEHRRVLIQCDCLAGDTKVLTSKGWKTLYEIAEDFEENNYPIKYLVDGKFYEGSAPFHKGKKPVYKMVYENGESVQATKDHRFLVKEPSKDPEWRALEDINVGDNLVVSQRFDVKLPKKTSDFYNLQFLGFMQGDGTVKAGPASKDFDLQIYDKDKYTLVSRFKQLGVVHKVKKTLEGAQKRKKARVAFNIKAKELAYRYGYDNTGVPCYKTREQFFGYLSGLICADASISSKKGIIKALLLRGDESYIKPIFESLIRYGFADTTMRLERKAGTKVNKDFVSSKDLYCLRISPKSFKYLKEYLELTPRFDEYEFAPFRNKVTTTKVVSKDFHANRDVYDIHVPKVNRFTINGGVIVHNCEAYTFYGFEYSNALKGAARIIYGNGDAPDFTNPGYVPGLCKHTYAVAYHLINKNL